MRIACLALLATGAAAAADADAATAVGDAAEDVPALLRLAIDNVNCPQADANFRVIAARLKGKASLDEAAAATQASVARWCGYQLGAGPSTRDKNFCFRQYQGKLRAFAQAAVSGGDLTTALAGFSVRDQAFRAVGPQCVLSSREQASIRSLQDGSATAAAPSHPATSGGDGNVRSGEAGSDAATTLTPEGKTVPVRRAIAVLGSKPAPVVNNPVIAKTAALPEISPRKPATVDPTSPTRLSVAGATKVLLIGDSLSGSDVGLEYRVAKDLGNQPGYQVRAFAQSGARPGHYTGRYSAGLSTGNLDKAWDSAVTAQERRAAVPSVGSLLGGKQPDVVVIQLGTNLGYTDSFLAKKKECLALLEQVKQQGGNPEVVWVMPPQNNGRGQGITPTTQDNLDATIRAALSDYRAGGGHVETVETRRENLTSAPTTADGTHFKSVQPAWVSHTEQAIEAARLRAIARQGSRTVQVPSAAPDVAVDRAS